MVRSPLRPPTALAVLGGLGLVVALAALMDTQPGLGDDALAVRIFFTVPDVLVVASAAVFALTGVILIAIARRRRKAGEEIEEAEPEGLRLPLWAKALLEILVLLPLLLLVAALWYDGGRIAAALLAWGRGLFYLDGPGAPGTPEIPAVSLPWLGWGVGLLGLVVALTTLALALLLLFGERLVAWWLARQAVAEPREPLIEAVDDSLDDLATEPDPRAAIIRCYRRFEQVTERARVPRPRWQTPDEFMRNALARLPVPPPAVEQLTRLFERARFSHHAVRSDDRDRARACLEDIRAALEPRDEPLAIG